MTIEEREDEVVQDCLNLLLMGNDLKELAIRRAFIAGVSFGTHKSREIVNAIFPKVVKQHNEI